MYESLRRRGDEKRPADAHDRRGSAGPHEGTDRDFLRRHGRESAEAARGTRKERAAFAAGLLTRVADPRNLHLALEHLAREGGQAPGPDGLRPRDLGRAERWDLARALGAAIQTGTYRPGRHRVVKIPKGPGRGTSALKVLDAQDRAVQRGAVQVLQPLLDPGFLPTTLGSRPRKGRGHALALAGKLAAEAGLRAWAAADVAGAFDAVPLGRLMDVLRLRLPAEDLLAFLEVMIGGTGGRGLRQGGAASPLLLNAYLDHALDRPWAKAHPKTPLLRYVDDLLVLTAGRAEAEDARVALEARLRSAGMPPKASKGAVRDLGAGESIAWLGYDLRMGDGGIEARIAPPSWARLGENLAELHDSPDAPVHAIETIEGWIDQAGPCYPHHDVDEVVARIRVIAGTYAF